MDTITVQNLKKIYRNGRQTVNALNDLSFEVPQGSIFGFLGPNGAGKSTTIGIILQFLHQNAGEVFLFGENVKDNLTILKRRIGFIPDADLPGINGLTLLKHTGKYYGYSGQDLRKRIIDVVKLTESKDFINRNTKRLSKGQKSRIKIANAILHDPDLIIADEPTSGLDPVGRRHFLNLIGNLSKNDGKTIFFSNHVIGEVEKICHDIVILSKGNIIAHGSIQDIIKLLPVSNKYIVTVENISKNDFFNLDSVKSVEEMSGNRYILETDESNHHTPAFVKELINNPKYIVHSFIRENVNLEDVFFQVIGEEVKA